MQNSKLVAVLLSLSSLAFATGHDGNDPSNSSPLGLEVVSSGCYHKGEERYARQWCSAYDRATDIIEAAPVHGRHGHNGRGWTAYKQWDVPTLHPLPKDLTIKITVNKGLDVIQNGERLRPNADGQYSILFSEGLFILTPSDYKEEPSPSSRTETKRQLQKLAEALGQDAE